MTWREPASKIETPSLEWPEEDAGEPDTIEDEFAKDDAPDQEYEEDV